MTEHNRWLLQVLKVLLYEPPFAFSRDGGLLVHVFPFVYRLEVL